VVGDYPVEKWAYNAGLGITACKLSCTKPIVQYQARYRYVQNIVEKQAYKWQPTRSSPRVVGVPGAVRGTVDYRGEQRTAVSKSHRQLCFRTHSLHTSSIWAPCSVQEHCKSSVFSPSGFPIKLLYAFLFAPTPVTCPAHLLFLDLIARLMNETLNQTINMWYSSIRTLLWAKTQAYKRSHLHEHSHNSRTFISTTLLSSARFRTHRMRSHNKPQ